MKTVLYPGTFDPVTNGHLNVLRRACKLFDKVIIAVADNEGKKPMFTAEERKRLIAENIAELGLDVEVIKFDALTVNLARELGAVAVIRGIRAVSDFEFEFQMTQMNRHLDPELETIFLMPNEEYFFISSNLLRQVARYGGDISALAPANVVRALEGRRDK